MSLHRAAVGLKAMPRKELQMWKSEVIAGKRQKGDWQRPKAGRTERGALQSSIKASGSCTETRRRRKKCEVGGTENFQPPPCQQHRGNRKGRARGAPGSCGLGGTRQVREEFVAREQNDKKTASTRSRLEQRNFYCFIYLFLEEPRRRGEDHSEEGAPNRIPAAA